MGIKKFPGLTGVPAITKEVVPEVDVKPSGKAALTCHVPPNPAAPDRVEELIVPDPATPTWNSRTGLTLKTGAGGFTAIFRVKACDVNPGFPP